MSAQVPSYFLMVIFAGWLNRQQHAAINFLKTENEILKSQLKGRRLRLSEEDRRRLAEKGRALGRMLLAEVACIVTPETRSGAISQDAFLDRRMSAVIVTANSVENHRQGRL